MNSLAKLQISKVLSLLVALVIGIVFAALPLSGQKAAALSGGEFQAGRIMDDAVFFNGASMSVEQIQEFLNAKLPVCDTNGQKTIYDSRNGDTVTRKIYAERRGVSTPFVCLKDYRQDTVNKNPEDALCSGHTAGNKSSAQIIAEVAQSCGVSAKVLLVLLQKEQSLVTDDWPWPNQYRSATGYGCPDTAPCDSQYYGFFNQVYMAARVYKYYAKYSNSFNHIAGRNNYVLYNPSTSCGGSTVFIQNQATAGLYNYTPYQPNAAALNNLYGTGDSCSAYGNRNFWRMYTDWFGSTYSGIAAQQFFNQAHPTGAIVREVVGGPIYKIIDGQRLAIPSYGVFLSHNYSDKQVKVLNRGDAGAQLSKERLGFRSGTLLRQGGDVKIYVVECANQFYSSCTKRHIANYETYRGLGYREADIINVASGDLSNVADAPAITKVDSHPSGTLIRDEATNKVYLVGTGKRYHVLSARLFDIQRFDWTKVKAMNAYDAMLPIEGGYPPYDTNLLAKSPTDVRIFAIGENGYGTTYKRHIGNYDTYLLLGYGDSDVRLLESTLLDSYVEIPPYK